MFGYIIFFIFLFIIKYTVKSNRRKLFWWCAILCVFSAIRYGIGYDYYSYYNDISTQSWQINLWEPIPRLFALFASNTNTFFFFFLSSFFIVLFLYKGITCCSIKNAWMTLLFFIAFPLFFMYYLNAIRQGMAFSVIFCAMSAYWNSPKKQILLILLACLCHISSIVAFLLLIPFQKIKTKYLLFTFVATFFVGEIVVGYFLPYVSNIPFLYKVEKYAQIGNDAVSDGRYIGYLIYAVNLFCLSFRDKHILSPQMTPYFKYMVALVCVGASMYAFFGAFDGTLAKRFSTMFFVAIIIIFPVIWRSMRLPRKLYSFFMVALFCMTVFLQASNHRDGETDTSPTYPYRTMIAKFNDGWN